MLKVHQYTGRKPQILLCLILSAAVFISHRRPSICYALTLRRPHLNRYRGSSSAKTLTGLRKVNDLVIEPTVFTSHGPPRLPRRRTAKNSRFFVASRGCAGFTALMRLREEKTSSRMETTCSLPNSDHQHPDPSHCSPGTGQTSQPQPGEAFAHNSPPAPAPSEQDFRKTYSPPVPLQAQSSVS